MQFSISRFDDTKSYAEFQRNYVKRDLPCVIHNTGLECGHFDYETEDGGAFRVWLATDPRFSTLQARTLRAYLAAEHYMLRKHWGRIFNGTLGGIAPYHFDGNFLDVFNLQVMGSKEWTIIDPATPPPLVPGTNFAAPISDNDLDKLRYARFRLNPGELLYLPRLWLHSVVSLAAQTTSVSWVITRLQLPESANPLFDRSLRYTDLYLRLKRVFPRIKVPNACLFNSVHTQDNEPLLDLIRPYFSRQRSLMFGAKELTQKISTRLRAKE